MSETVEISSSDDEECFKEKIISIVEPNSLKRKLDKTENDEDNDESKLPKLESSDEDQKENIEQTNDSSVDHIQYISKLFEDSDELTQLLKIFYEKFTKTKLKNVYIDKIKLLKPHVDNIYDYINSDEFKHTTKEKIELCKNATVTFAVQQFADLFREIESASKRILSSSDSSNFHDKAIKRLEHFLEQLQKKIRELEDADVDFDDEENSSFLQLEKYKERAFKVYKKLCTFYKQSAYLGDATKNKLDFCGSERQEINVAINKVFKDGTKFPNYSQMEQIIRKCVEEKKLGLTESCIKTEAKSCFRKVGNLLQRRRQLDLYNMHTSYLTGDEPPEDGELLQKLIKNKKDANEKISKICEDFVRLQDEGKEVEISGDSDDSEYVSSEDEPQNNSSIKN